MLAGELGPGDRLHLGGRVELHGARPERNHAAVQRDVLVGQRPQVAHHLGLGAVPGERGMGEELRRAGGDVGRRRTPCGRPRRWPRTPSSTAATCASVVASSQDTETWSASTSQRLMPRALAAARTSCGPAGHPGQHGVEERGRAPPRRPPPSARRPARARGRARGARSRSARRRRDSWRTSRRSPPAAPARCRCCWSPCRGGCAARGSAAPAGRPATPSASTRHPDQPAGQLAGVLGVHGEVAGVRSAESHWHAETLGGAERDVGADLAGRGDQRQRQQVGADRDQRAALVGLRSTSAVQSTDRAAGAGQLGDHAEELAVGQAVRAGRR